MARCIWERTPSDVVPISAAASGTGKKAGLLALLYFSVAEPNLGLGKTLFEGE